MRKSIDGALDGNVAFLVDMVDGVGRGMIGGKVII